MKDAFDIYNEAALLRKVLLDDATDEEKLQAQALLKEHPELRKQYEGIFQKNVMAGEFERYDRFRGEQAYRRFLEKVRPSSGHIRKHSFRLWYSAAVVLLLIGAFAVWKMTAPQTSVKNEVTILSPGNIKGQVLLPGGKALNVAARPMAVVVAGVKVTYRQGLLSYSPVQVNLSDTSSTRQVFNKFVIPRGGENTVQLSDGTTVHMNAASELVFPMCFSGGQRVVELKGEAYFDVKKDAEHPFIVRTKYGDVSVLGTAFNVNAYADRGRCEVTLVRGKVRFTNPYRESVVLEPGDQAVAAGNLLHKRAVDVDDYISWTRGVYNFRNESLNDILSTFSKWYDVDVVYENSDIPYLTYTGTVKRYDTMNAFLDVFEMTGDLTYRIEGRKVYFSKRE